jgi:hypothetical protein
MEFLSCPKCSSDQVRRSHTRGMRERLLKKLGWRVYRCREKACGWRGLIQTEPTRDIVKAFMVAHKPALIGFGVVMAIIVIMVPVLLCSME